MPARSYVRETETPLDNSVSIKQWPKEDRPREKLLSRGAEALTDAELIAILLQSGSAGKSALDLAKNLIRIHGNVRRIACRPINELVGMKGIGPARAVTLIAAFELGRRNIRTEELDEPVRSPEDVANRYIPRMRDLATERFVVLLLNNSGRIVRECVISEGTVNASLVHPREVFKAAVTELATSIILLHNHPSGVKSASKEDHAITRQLVEAGKLMDIPVSDHIIVCGNSYISFAENGWI